MSTETTYTRWLERFANYVELAKDRYDRQANHKRERSRSQKGGN